MHFFKMLMFFDFMPQRLVMMSSNTTEKLERRFENLRGGVKGVGGGLNASPRYLFLHYLREQLLQ